MKKIMGVSLLSVAILCLSAAHLEARGGRGGGRSAPSQRGGQAAAAQSRQSAAARSTPQQGIRRQSAHQQQINRPPTAQRHAGSNPPPAAQTRTRTGSAVHARQSGRRDIRQFLNLSPAAAARHAAVRGGRGGGFVPRHVNRSHINHQFARRYARAAHRPFYPAWYASHAPAYWHHWHYGRYRPGYWWGWATAGMISGWIVYDWATPYYYSYGTGGNVYYVGDVVYIDGRPTYSSGEYYQQAATIAGNVPEMDQQQAEKLEWMPLGVFAVVKDDATDSSDLVLQLAVSKEGVISGTMLNESTQLANAVEGSVDKKTQRAAWSFLDGENNVIMETGIYNLSKDEANVLVHLGPKETKIWTLARLEKPAAAAASDGSTTVVPAAESSPEIVPSTAPHIAPAATDASEAVVPEP